MPRCTRPALNRMESFPTSRSAQLTTALRRRPEKGARGLTIPLTGGVLESKHTSLQSISKHFRVWLLPRGQQVAGIRGRVYAYEVIAVPGRRGPEANTGRGPAHPQRASLLGPPGAWCRP